jgi:hypothetical protein
VPASTSTFEPDKDAGTELFATTYWYPLGIEALIDALPVRSSSETDWPAPSDGGGNVEPDDTDWTLTEVPRFCSANPIADPR